MFITVVNHSAKISDHDVNTMVRVCAHQMRYHVAPLWDRHAPAVVFSTLIQPGSYTIGIFDTADDPGALGWHTEDSNGTVYGKVFVDPVLQAGGTPLVGELTVASVLSHEVIEAFCDPAVNSWVDDGNGKLYALEAGDPVESDSYNIHIAGIDVGVSNFVTPAWFDPQAPVGSKFDYLGKVTEPFTMTKGGYVVWQQGSEAKQQFGEEYPEWRKGSKESPLARTARRVKKTMDFGVVPTDSPHSAY